MTKSKAVSRARQLRQEMTDAERLLWARLRNKQLGQRFRRQVPIGQYIVDFVCFEQRIVIEVDGGQHAASNQMDYDQQRSFFLEKEGFQVLRFWNHEVMTNLEGVLMTIKERLR